MTLGAAAPPSACIEQQLQPWRELLAVRLVTPVHARTRATLDTAGPTFVVFLLGVIVIVGGLIYFPMLILGPIGERIVGMRPMTHNGSQRPEDQLAQRGQGTGQEMADSNGRSRPADRT